MIHTPLEQLSFDASFFMPEVREGFYIPVMMKRYWAAQLTVLSEVAKVCARHNIPWYADNGSLLGTIRHSGYIPWDDDIDICMLRHDLDFFFRVAKEELPAGYVVLDIHSGQETTTLITRVLNTEKTDFSDAHMSRFYGCPYIAGVDIFPLDGVFDDTARENERRLEGRTILNAIDLITDGQLASPDCIRLLQEIGAREYSLLSLLRDMNEDTSEEVYTREIVSCLLLILDRLYRACPSETASRLALMRFWIPFQSHLYQASWFSEAVMMPFEHTLLPVGAHYQKILKLEYGDYMRVAKTGGVHGYPIYSATESFYEEQLGRHLFRYTFSVEDLRHPRGESLPAYIYNMTDTLHEAHGKIRLLLDNSSHDTVIQLLTGCQSIAVSIGTCLEARYGEDCIAVRLLEDYCDDVYQVSICPEPDRLQQLEDRLSTVITTVQELFSHHKEIVFLLPEHLPDARALSLAKTLRSNPQNDVLIYRIPLTSLCSFHESIAAPSVTEITSCNYSFDKRLPDCIVTIFPFDGTNTAVTVPSGYYSGTLKKYTGNLIYVPCYEPDVPVSGNEKGSSTLRELIEQPAVMLSDYVLVNSKHMRDYYIDALTALSGEEWRRMWQEKIITSFPAIL